MHLYISIIVAIISLLIMILGITVFVIGIKNKKTNQPGIGLLTLFLGICILGVSVVAIFR